MAAKNTPTPPDLLSHKMEITYWPIERITPYDRNPRKMDKARIAKLAATLKRFGWRQPIVVDVQGEIVAGTRRYWAAKSLELTEAPVHIASDLTPQQIAEWRLVDNKASEDGEWDDSLLIAELLDLSDLGTDVTELGFKAFEEKMNEADAEAIAETPEEAAESNDRKIGRDGIVNAVFYMADIPALEAALKKTGQMNRGKAFGIVCKAYLEDGDNLTLDMDGLTDE